MVGKLRRFLPAFLLLALCGCSPGYVLRAAYEEARIQWRAEPIAAVLERGGVDQDARGKLRMVLEVRDFAARDLGLNVGGSYAAYSHVDRDVLLHVLSAVPKTSLEPYTWWFPFVGRVPYKGYFDGSAARREAESLAARGYDTHVRPASAFSTLGWLDDPLLRRLLALDRVALAEVVLHELLHNTLFVAGAAAFNESLANFVGKTGAAEFFARRRGPGSPEARRARQAWRHEVEFSCMMMELAGRLRRLYRGPAPEAEKLARREQAFARSQRRWARRLAGRPGHRHAWFSRAALDNAVVLQHLLYVTHLARFDELYRRHGGRLSRSIEAVGHALRDAADPFDALPPPAGPVRGTGAGAVSPALCEAS